MTTPDFTFTSTARSNPNTIIPKCRGFKMGSLNITSLLKHIDELRIILNDQSIDVLAINETRLDKNISDQEVNVQGYDIIRRDRPINGRFGGGVCFYIRSNINYSIRKDLDNEFLEILSIEFRKPNSKPFVVTSWYRPPNSPQQRFSHLDTLLGKLDSENVELFLMGDMNCDLLSKDNVYAKALLNVTGIYGLKQLINEPTRITPLTSTLIDLIFTNQPDNVYCSGVSHIAISDHSLVYVFRKISFPSASKGINLISYRQFKHFNSANFRADIFVQPWGDLQQFHNPNDMWKKWKDLFLTVCDRHAPLKIKRTRNTKSPWITTILKKRMNCRDRLKRKAIKTNDPSIWNQFRTMRNQVNRDIHTAKQAYYKNAFNNCSGDQRKTWKTINELTSRKSNKTVINEIDYNGQKSENQTDVAEMLNSFFTEIGPNLSSHVTKVEDSFEDFLSETEENFIFEKTTTAQVFSLLSKLSQSKATGLDNISAKLLRQCPDLLAESLTVIFNQSLITGIFPDEWKSARVTPLYKNSGKRNEPTNYRPISVIPVVAKVFERIIYEQVYHYLIKNSILTCHQSGFRSLHSTVTALLEATDSWAMNIDRGLINAVVFLDLKKAFDTVDHEILLRKLQYYGLRQSSYKWFASYLDNRTQICQINCRKSTPKSLKCGVPQGTILGPLLFLLYINDLPNCLQFSLPRMYADDTSLTFASADVQDVNDCLNYDLSKVYTWLSANKLTLNLTKTEFMLIASRQKLSNLSDSPSLTINNMTVEQVSSTKSLGVCIDQTLNWESHIENISKKIASAIGAIKRIRHQIPFNVVVNVYNSLVQPHFDYCCEVWADCNKGLSDRLQKLQNRAARILMSANYDSNLNDLFRALRWRKLCHQRLEKKSIMLYKILHDMTPEYLRSGFVFRDSVNSYHLRNTENALALPKPRTDYLKRSFSYSGAQLWNSLPLELRQATSLRDFKNELSRHSFE